MNVEDDTSQGSPLETGGAPVPNAQLAGVLSVAEDAIISVDSELRIRFFNRGAERIFGYAPGDVVGEPLDLLLPERFRASHGTRVAEFGRSSHTARMMNERGKVAGRRKSGEEFPAEVSISKLEIGAETVYTAILRDVTERERIEAQLRQTQKLEAIGRLAGGVAHDFNNLLTIIGGYTSMLSRGLEANHPGRKDAEQILRACARAAELTSQLLAFSMRRMVSPSITDLNELVRETERMLRPAIGAHIEFVTKLDSTLDSVIVDPGQFEQVLTNLALNARDAMPEGGRLTIETTNAVVGAEWAEGRSDVPRGAYVSITVSDTGHGMDAETLTQVFEPFFTTKYGAKGTGLGLATVYGIVKQSGGHVWVESTIGKGSTFRLLLPRAVGQPTPRAVEESTEAHRGSATVLLVEDEDGIREWACCVLKDAGYAVLDAASGPEALELAASYDGPIDLLLTDVVMPRMLGPAVAGRLTAARPNTRVLYMSGHTKDEPLHNGVLGGKAPFLAKPFSPADLLRATRDVLRSSEGE